MSLPEPSQPPGEAGSTSTPETSWAETPPVENLPGEDYPPWSIWEPLGVLALFTSTQFSIGLAMDRLASGFSNLPMDKRLAIAMPASLLISHLLAWVCIAWVVGGRHRLPLLEGLRLRRPVLRGVVSAFTLGMLLQAVAAALTVFFPPPEDFRSPIEDFIHHGTWAIALLFLMAVVMAPPLEEALFRGLLQPALRRRFGFPLAALVVTVLFTSLHATQTGTYWPPLVGIGLCGMALSWLRERSGSLCPPIAFHIGFNLTAFIPVFLVGQFL